MTLLYIDTIAKALDRIAALEARCRELEAEVNEQARVNGMGGSREARLLARVAEIEAALREVLADRIDAEWSMGTDWTEKVDRLLAPSTSETPAKHMEGCRCPECDPDFNDPRGDANG